MWVSAADVASGILVAAVIRRRRVKSVDAREAVDLVKLSAASHRVDAQTIIDALAGLPADACIGAGGCLGLRQPANDLDAVPIRGERLEPH